MSRQIRSLLRRLPLVLACVLLPLMGPAQAEAGFDGAIESPSHGSTVPQPFTLSGWAIDTSSSSGPGVDAVYIYVCPVSNCNDLTYWGQATYGISRPDIANYFGDAKFTYSGFSFVVTGRAADEYMFYAYAHDTVTDQWLPIIIGATVQANVSNPIGDTSTPVGGASVTQPFSLTGWAIDLGAPSGTGVDYVNVYACQWHNCNGFVNGYGTTYGVTRTDIATQYGSQFTNSGFQVSITGLPANEYQLRAYSHVVLTNGWYVPTIHLYVNLTTPALTIDRGGTGTGGISASGLSCPGGSTTQGVPCGANYALHTVVTLTPQPDPGSTFGGWIGACTGTGTCQVTMSNAKFVSATFSKIPSSIDTTYYHTDVVGSVRALTDATGAVIIRHDYTPFGEDAQPMTGDPMRFAGKELDPETALHYFSARYYRQSWGRFSQVDPLHVGAAMVDPQQWNRYAYARNNPLAWGDPSGLTASHNDGNGWYFSDGGWCFVEPSGCRPAEWWESPGFDATTGYGFGSDPGVIDGFGDGGSGGFFTLMEENRQALAETFSYQLSVQQGYDASKKGPEDPTRPGSPLIDNPALKPAIDQAWTRTALGRAELGRAEAGFAINLIDGQIRPGRVVDSINSPVPNRLSIEITRDVTIAIYHTHGNSMSPLPSRPSELGRGDYASPIPNYVASSAGQVLYVTIPYTTNHIRLK